MFKINSKKIITAVFPFAILLVAWILAMGAWIPYSRLNVAFVTLSYVFAFFALVLSVWFQHSRVFYSVSLLLCVMLLLSVEDRFHHKALVNGISLLIPVAFILLSLVEERGITSKHGLIKGFIFIIMILFVILDALRTNPWLAGLRLEQLLLDGYREIDGIPRLSVFLFIICLCILLIRFLVLSSTLDMSFICVSLSCFIILHFTSYPNILSVFFSAGFLIFILALFDASYSLAFHDPLTGLLSRRAMELEILRLGSKFAIAMIDIDLFKKVNDTHGHQVGDDVLKMVASIIERNAIAGKVFRYGGEEFAVIFPRKTKAEVINDLEHLRACVEKRPLIIRSIDRPRKKPKIKTPDKNGLGTVKVTVSIGIADNCGRANTPGQVIEAADKALYKAKTSGRNKVM